MLQKGFHTLKMVHGIKPLIFNNDVMSSNLLLFIQHRIIRHNIDSF